MAAHSKVKYNRVEYRTKIFEKVKLVSYKYRKKKS